MIFSDITLVTDDVCRLRDFYARAFGAEGFGDEDHGGVALPGLHLTIDSARMLRGTEAFRSASPAAGDHAVLSFDAEDVDAEYARLLALGIEALCPPTTHPWGARSFQFRDPDGNMLNIRTTLRAEGPAGDS